MFGRNTMLACTFSAEAKFDDANGGCLGRVEQRTHLDQVIPITLVCFGRDQKSFASQCATANNDRIVTQVTKNVGLFTNRVCENSHHFECIGDRVCMFLEAEGNQLSIQEGITIPLSSQGTPNKERYSTCTILHN
jgi:hypothetical protein